MKKYHIILLGWVGIAFGASAQTNLKSAGCIQTQIQLAVDRNSQVGAQSLRSFIAQLENQGKITHDSWYIYWEAFANYRLASLQINNNRDSSELSIEKACTLLENVKDKNSEDYALLGLSLGFSLSFKANQASEIVAEIQSCFKKSLELDPHNLRAYLAIATNDYYTPKEYGGGTVTEQNLLKALQLNPQDSNDLLKPTWGKNNVYELLVSFYLRENRKKEALIYCKKGLTEFPDDLILHESLTHIQ